MENIGHTCSPFLPGRPGRPFIPASPWTRTLRTSWWTTKDCSSCHRAEQRTLLIIPKYNNWIKAQESQHAQHPHSNLSPFDLPLNYILFLTIPPSLLWDHRLHKSPWVLGHPGNTRLHHWQRNMKWLASWETAKWAWQRAHLAVPNHSTSADCWRRAQQTQMQKTGPSATVFLAGSGLPLLTEFTYNHTMIIHIISC